MPVSYTHLFQTDPFALGLFTSAGLPRKLFAEQPGGGVASVLGCTDLGKFIGQACDFRRKACDRLLRTGHARVEVGLEPLKLLSLIHIYSTLSASALTCVVEDAEQMTKYSVSSVRRSTCSTSMP